MAILAGAVASAQVGPGGVGAAGDLMIWLSADHGVSLGAGGVSAWADRLGNGRIASEANSARQPQRIANAFNGYPALFFDNDINNADRLVVPDHASLSGMAGMTAYCAFDLHAGTDVGAPRAILSKRNGVSEANAYAWFHWNGGSGSTIRQHFDLNNTGNRLNGTVSYAPGSLQITSLYFAGNTAPDNLRQRLFRGNSAGGNKSIAVATVPVTAADLYIGSLNGHPGTGASTTRFNGHIAEVIMYGVALNESQRIIVNNYLAAKYGLELDALDLYTMDEPANGNFDHEVAGIGRISASDLHTEARGTGIVHIGGATGLDNGEFMLWGHDNGLLGAWGASDMPSGLEGRLHRVWRVSELNTAGVPCDVGAVDITLHLEDLGPVNASDLRLLVDNNADGLFANDAPIAGAVDLGDGRYRFSAVTALSHGTRFTIGTTNISTTPLPVELIAFHARPLLDRVQLDWATASETGSERFDIQRSADATTWEVIGSAPAAQNSVSRIVYEHTDHEPLPGISFYRLVQVDLDGSLAVSDVVPVSRRNNARVSVHPLPFNDHFVLSTTSGPPTELDLVDASGRPVRAPWSPLDNGARVDTQHLAAGRYVLHVRTEAGRSVEQVIKMP